ncbi:MAG: YifB family Mg chelatase-like AAA ATPase [Patescibacteria group bacterium]
MSVRLFSASIHGIDARPIEVEVDSSPGVHAFTIVGLADKAVRESEDRIASAIRNSGFSPASAKNKKILVNLAPADVKKEGPSYDLSIAIGYLLETKQIKFDPSDKLFAGELSLDGTIKHVNGVLAMALLAKKIGIRELVIPHTDALEGAVVEGISVIGVKSLPHAIGYLNGTISISPTPKPPTGANNAFWGDSFLHIRGQHAAKRALTVAAAGNHNVLMSGPPGAGKSLLAKSLAELLPQLTFPEALEVTKIYSSVGLTDGKPLLVTRPFRNPHHTTSPAAIVGGGTWPRPGEISLAHCGVLFLDELPEFQRNVLESLRQPMEDGVVTIARAAGSLTIPAQFALVAAMNPCPCGNWGSGHAECVCSPYQVIKYQRKVSGPLLDRIDIQINVPRETLSSHNSKSTSEELDRIRASVTRARKIQEQRLGNVGLMTNSQIDFRHVDKLCRLDQAAERILAQASQAKNLSLRACHKIKKLARTIADLAGSEVIQQEHLAEAIAMRINEQMFAEFG